MLCQPTKRNLARFNCKTGRREFTPDDNEQPGPSTEPSVVPGVKSNNLLPKQRSLSGKPMHLSISATESINLLPKGNDKQRSKTALPNTGRNKFTNDIAKGVGHLEKHVISRNAKQRSKTALPNAGRKRFTDEIAYGTDSREKQLSTCVTKNDDSETIQNSNVEPELIQSPMTNNSNNDHLTEIQMHMIHPCQDGILTPVEQSEPYLAKPETTDIEPKAAYKKDTNRKFSSVYLTENADDSETDDDDKETIVETNNINYKERVQYNIDNKTFHTTARVECFHESDGERHARESSTDDGYTGVLRDTQLRCTPVHCQKINGDVGDESSDNSRSITYKEDPEFNYSKVEESVGNDNTFPSVECVAIFSTDNELSEANTRINLTTSFETINHSCLNVLGADDGTITLKEIDNDIINENQNNSRTRSRLVIDATDSYSCTPDYLTGHVTSEGTLSGEIKIIQEKELIDSFKYGTCDERETAMPLISDKNKKSDELKEEQKTFGENNGDRNDTPAYACASETRITALHYNMTCLDGNNDRAVKTLRNSFASLESKIVIPTDYGEDSSDFDHTDSEYEAETAASKHSDDDVAELKALLEMTTCRRAEYVKTDNTDKEPENIEITNGQPSEDYVQFLREKTMDTKKVKKIKKVKARKNDKKEKIHKPIISHERNAKTKPTNDARQKKVVTDKPKTTHKQDSTKKTKKKSKHV